MSLTKILPRQLGATAVQQEQEALKRNTRVKGRQALRVVYDWLRADGRTPQVYGYADLNTILWMGDTAADMQKFLSVLGQRSRQP